MASKHRKHHPAPTPGGQPLTSGFTRSDGTATAAGTSYPNGPGTAPAGLQPSAERTPAEEVVRQRAYYKWMAAGCPASDGKEFWLEAEAELLRAGG